MTTRTTVFVPGFIYWAKIIGAPRSNYEGTGKEWSYDLVPDDTTFLKEHRLLDRLKDAREPITKEFLRLKKAELTKDGEKNDPIRIYDRFDEPWDGSLIGNGTRVVAKLQIVDWGVGKKKSIYTQALRVEDLVPFTANEFGAFDAKTEASPEKEAAKPAPKKAKTVLEELDELDDEIPPFD